VKHTVDDGCDYSPHRATPDRTGPEMTDYFTSTTVTSRIKAQQ